MEEIKVEVMIWRLVVVCEHYCLCVCDGEKQGERERKKKNERRIISMSVTGKYKKIKTP